MITRKTLLIFIGGIILGGVIGTWSTSRFWRHRLSGTRYIDHSIACISNVKALRRLREQKNDEAVNGLEIALDGEIVSLAQDLEQGGSFSLETRRALGRIADYRKGSGYVPSDPQMRTLVQNALRSAQ